MHVIMDSSLSSFVSHFSNSVRCYFTEVCVASLYFLKYLELVEMPLKLLCGGLNIKKYSPWLRMPEENCNN